MWVISLKFNCKLLHLLHMNFLQKASNHRIFHQLMFYLQNFQDRYVSSILSSEQDALLEALIWSQSPLAALCW